ncbi:MAG: RDD family protein [Neisseriaceae bacterium]|nr:RDD family protein [Neisseriaceae bacterium]
MNNTVNNTEIEVELASAGQRIAAYIINNAIWFVLMFIMGFVWAALVGKPTEADTVKLGMWVIAVSIIYLVIQVILMSRDGQSIGKKIMGIKVIDANGETAGFVRFFLLREIVFSIVFVVNVIVFSIPLNIVLDLNGQYQTIPALVMTIICGMMLYFAKDRRTLQDRLANTYVIKLPKKLPEKQEVMMREEVMMKDSEIEVELASPRQRISAVIINGLIYFAVVMITVAISFSLGFDKKQLIVLPILGVLIVHIVQLILMSRDGQTIGKKIMGVKVIDADGETAGFVRFFLLREAVYNIILTILGVPLGVALNSEQAAQIPAFIALLICLVMLFVAIDRRTLQDKLANTYVIQLPKKKSSVSFKVK